MADAPVVDIRSAKPRVPGAARLRIKVTPGGGLELRMPGAPVYVVAPNVAQKMLEQLSVGCQRARYRALGIPAAAPERGRKEGPGSCHRKRDGGLGVTGQGCRRRRKHEGRCRDAGGDFTPAACLHTGRGRTTIWVKGTSGGMVGFVHCAHCNGEIGPVPPGTSCPMG